MRSRGWNGAAGTSPVTERRERHDPRDDDLRPDDGGRSRGIVEDQRPAGRRTLRLVQRREPYGDRLRQSFELVLDERLRATKERILLPVAGRLRGVSPMVLTVGSLGVGLAAAWAAAGGWNLVALVLWLANRLLDGLDGEVARRSSRDSDLGGYADLLADFVVYALVPIGLAYGQADPAAWRFLAWMLASFYLNAGSWILLTALLEKRRHSLGARRTSLHMPAGLIEGTETMLLYVLFLLLPGQLPILFAVAALLVMVTAAQRLLWARRRLGSAT